MIEILDQTRNEQQEVLAEKTERQTPPKLDELK